MSETRSLHLIRERRLPSRRANQQQHINGGGGGDVTASLRSSINSQGSLYPSNSHYSTTSTIISPSGNRLVMVNIPEDDVDIELDKDEIRRMIHQNDESGDIDNMKGESGSFKPLDGASVSSSSVPSRSSSSNVTNSIAICGINTACQSQQTEIDKAQKQLKEYIYSPPFRRTLFLGICLQLFGVGVFFSLENMMGVKSVSDWIEPTVKSRHGRMDGGVDWTFGKRSC